MTDLIKLTKKTSSLTVDWILSKITSYDIYRYYFGDFQIGKRYLNHLRNDKTGPSFIISFKNSELVHIDFANDYWRGNCFKLVQQIYGCDFKRSLEIIASDFGLIGELKASPIVWKSPKIVIENKTKLIQVVTRKFNSEELKYWNDNYQIGEEDLVKSEIVYAIKDLYLERERMSTKNDLVFAYRFGDYWKIYRPFNSENKWMTNCPIDVMYGLQNIKKGCGLSIITKSVKDYLVCKKFISSCTCGVQNESSVAINDENISYILDNSQDPYIIFDNDSAGVKSCTFYNRKGFKYWNIPKSYYNRHGIKDPSDFVKVYGADRFIKEVSKKIKC